MSVIIRLQLLPLSASAADVRSFFSGLRIPDGAVHIVGGPEGDAFIGFASDEDARQAMRRDRGKIHGEEIRLLLSSRAEMNQVISRAKAAALGHRAPSPTGQQSPSTPQISQEAPVSVTSMNWGGHAQTAIPLSSDDSGQPSSFAPDPSDYNKPLYTRGPPAQSPAKSPAETPFGAFRDPTRLPSTGGYQANFAQRDQHSPSDAPRFFGSQPSRGTVLNSSIGSGRGSGIGGLPMPPGHQNGSAYRGFPPSNTVSVDTQQLIEDRSHNQPQNYSSQTRTTGPLFQDMKQDMKTDSVDEVNGPATGSNSNLPIHLRPPFGIPPAHLRGLLPVPQQSRGQGGRDVGAIDGRKERSSFQQDRVLYGRNDGVTQRDERERLPRFNRGRGSSPSEPRFMNGVPPRASQQQVVRNESWRDSGPTKNEKPWEALTSRGTSHNGPSGAPSHQRKTLLSSTSIPKPNGNSTTSGPSIQTTALPPVSGSPPSSVRPSTIASDGALRYVEFSRLPTEMLRPAVLEQFLKPTVPLTVSSVKVVCSSQGIHLHTLVRFENSADAQAMIMRDGEMGIRVRPSTKAIFDEAVDGPPPITSQLPSLLHDLNTNDNRDGALPLDHNDSRDQLRKRTRSRSRSRSPRRRRGIRGRRRGFRSRSRSRDRDRNGRGARFGRRSRSRSPHRKTHQDPTRWCLQLTNVPFRCSEEELRQWFSERVRPTRLIRTFYADGNASDRWIAEFESESLLERARGIRGLCLGRTIKMNYIDNDLADELMKIEDKYGENKKIEGEKQLLADVKHFNYTPIRPVGECIRGRGGAVGIPLGRPINAFPPLAPVVPRMMMGPRGPMLPGLPPGMPPIIPPESAGGPSLGVLRGRGAMTMRGRSAPLGVRSGLFATKLNRIQSSAESGTEVEERIEAQVVDENRAGLSENTGGEAHNSAVDLELVASIGPKGTVLSCRGFPSDITLEDVVGFFDRFPVDENSVRMRMGDDGVPTGECMLAIRDPESARNAVSSLAGKCLRGQKVFMHLANP